MILIDRDELETMIQIEIDRLTEINPNHWLLGGVKYMKGYVTSCVDPYQLPQEAPSARKIIEAEKVRLETQLRELGERCHHGTSFKIEALGFALECLDKEGK